MYSRLGYTTYRLRPVRPESHTGTWQDFPRRYLVECDQRFDDWEASKRAFCARLLERIADVRNLRAAWEHLRRFGGDAPGPDGRTFEEFNEREMWQLLRTTSQQIQNGAYRPGPERTIWIDKESGNGKRPLRLQNIVDRAVQRGAVQILQPILDRQFDELSFGFRPHRHRMHALATGGCIAHQEDRWVWITEDLADAFENVSQNRLLQILRKALPDDRLIAFLTRMIENGRRRGLRQGAPASPLLLNAYLNHFLDRKWRKQHPDIPLLRVADDLLVLCKTIKEAKQARSDLRRILRDAGMPLKVTKEETIRDLRKGQSAKWLGFIVSRTAKGEIELALADRAWKKLRKAFADCHTKPASSLRANEVALAWIDQQGPAHSRDASVRNETFRRIQSLAAEQAFDELPSLDVMERRSRAAHGRWQRIRLNMQRKMARAPGQETNDPRPSAGGRGALDLVPLQAVTIYTDGSCLADHGVGGAACILQFRGENCDREFGIGLRQTTSNRAELRAFILALRQLKAPSRIELFTDSTYLASGIAEWLPFWRANAWYSRGLSSRPISNQGLWKKIAKLLEPHQLFKVEGIPAHSGHPENERCDRLARRAAKRLQRQILNETHGGR